jgi:hypothetical protein
MHVAVDDSPHGHRSHSGFAQKGSEDECCLTSTSSILHCTPVQIKRQPEDDAAVLSATNAAPYDPRALVREEARKCSLTRLRNLVKKQDPSVPWYAFSRKKLQEWLVEHCTISVFGVKHPKKEKVATPITSTGDWCPAPLPGGWIINPEVDRRTQAKAIVPDASYLKMKAAFKGAPSLGYFSYTGQAQRRDDLDFWYCVPPKPTKRNRVNSADVTPCSVVVSSSVDELCCILEPVGGSPSDSRAPCTVPIADDTAVTAIHGGASAATSVAEYVALQHLTAPEHDKLNFEPQDDCDTIIDYNTNSGNSLSEHVCSVDVVAGGSDTSDYSSGACLHSSVVDSLELKMGDDSSQPIIAIPTSWSVYDGLLLLVLNICFD